MEDVGVTPMDAQGKEFDANLHNAGDACRR